MKLMKIACLAVFAALAPGLTPCLVHAQGELSTTAMEGAVGPYHVGADITMRDHTVFVAGHYFYASHLTDIPLAGAADGEDLTLTEPEGGVFHLHLTANAETTERPLTFYNSTGLAGTWTKGDVVLPVELGFETFYPGYGPSNRYLDVTGESDADFEARARRFLHGVLNGNREEAAGAVSFPLTVNGGTTMTLKDKASLYAHWDGIFTPDYVDALRDALPHEMFVHDGMAMVSHGLVWFDAGGAKVLNLLK